MKIIDFNAAMLVAAAALAGFGTDARADTLVVSSYYDSTIWKVTETGEVTTFATVPNRPYGMAFNRNGDLWVAVSQFTNLIWKITPAGIGTLLQPTPNRFDATEMTFGPDGSLYLASQGGYGIQRRTTTGSYVNYATNFSLPFGMAFDQAGSLFASDLNNNRITKIAPNRTASIFASNVIGCRGLAFDADGNLYVAASSAIFKFTPAGVRSTFVSGLQGASGIAFDTSGDLYVTEFGPGTLKRVTRDGIAHPFASGFQGPQFVAVQPDLSAPRLRVKGLGALEVSGGINCYYVTSVSENLTNWTVLSTNRISGGTAAQMDDPAGANAVKRFYKAVLR